VGTVKIQHC